MNTKSQFVLYYFRPSVCACTCPWSWPHTFIASPFVRTMCDCTPNTKQTHTHQHSHGMCTRASKTCAPPPLEWPASHVGRRDALDRSPFETPALGCGRRGMEWGDIASAVGHNPVLSFRLPFRAVDFI